MPVTGSAAFEATAGHGAGSDEARLLERFFAAVQRRDHQAVAACYDEGATFEDIAFALSGRRRIHAMWHMIARSDMRLTYAIEHAGAGEGVARWTAEYTFRDRDGSPGRHVRNEVRSTFTIADVQILRQVDRCDALRWGVQALGPVRGVVSWLVPALRRRAARRKLDRFVAQHPQYG